MPAARWACWCGRSAACARCATTRAAAATRCEPTDAATQRQALELIAHNVLSIDGLAVTPALQRRLAPDFDDRGDEPGLPTDYPVPQRLLDLQRAVLNQLMSDAVAARILDSVGKADRPEAAFQLSELYARLNRDVWSELAKGGNITATRRELQREHVNRLRRPCCAPARRPAPTRAACSACRRCNCRRSWTRR